MFRTYTHRSVKLRKNTALINSSSQQFSGKVKKAVKQDEISDMPIPKNHIIFLSSLSETTEMLSNAKTFLILKNVYTYILLKLIFIKFFIIIGIENRRDTL